MSEITRKNEYLFSKEEIKNISLLSETLQKVRARLVDEKILVSDKAFCQSDKITQ